MNHTESRARYSVKNDRRAARKVERRHHALIENRRDENLSRLVNVHRASLEG